MDYRHLLYPTLALTTLFACNKSAPTNDPIPATPPHLSTQITAPDHPTQPIEDGLQAEIIEPTPKEPTFAWTLVTTLDAPIDFAPLDHGILLSAGAQTLTLDEGQLVAAPAKALTKGTPSGSWPDNAWVTKTRAEERAGLYVRMSKWKGNKRWVPQAVKSPPEAMWQDEGKWYETGGDFWAHVGGRGGYLMAIYDWDEEVITFRRLAGKNFAPLDWDWDYDEHDTPYDILEAPSGRLFAFARDGESELRVHERGFCRQNCKIETHELPEAARDKIPSRSVVLDDDHIAMGLRVSYDSSAPELLLVGGEGEWDVARPPLAEGVFRHYLPGLSGELFAVVGSGSAKREGGETLWHRDHEGEWQALTMPEGVDAEGLSFDLARADDETLWVAVNGPEHHAIYALPVALG